MFGIWCLLSIIYYYTDQMTRNGIDESVLYHLLYGLQGTDYKAFRYIFLKGGGLLLLTAIVI